jgi:acetyltransferase-like isoleucine patch superfamily enzyme
LVMGECAGISQRHYFDCSDSVMVAPFATIGGVRSTFLTHHVDLDRGRQFCAPIRVGDHSFVSTNCVLLGGSALPDRSILGARSLMLDSPGTTHRLYAGSPAVEVKVYREDLPWFQRRTFRSY